MSFMSQNQTSFSFPGVFSTASVPQAEFEHEGPKIDHSFHDIPSTDSSWSSNTLKSKSQTKLEEINPSMASLSLTTTPFGVLLPVCLLAVFLSCVVCVYHWHSVRERRLDLEDERKRRSRIVSDFDAGCVLRTFKPVDKKVRMYPWKSTRIQDLPDINNNDGFEIPYYLGASSKAGCYHVHGRRRPAVGHISEPYERPALKRNLIHNNTTVSTRELSETDFSLKLPSSWSADTQTNSCVVASIKNEKTGLDDDCYVTGIREEVIRLTHLDLDGQVVVQTVNGSLLEYWV